MSGDGNYDCDDDVHDDGDDYDNGVVIVMMNDCDAGDDGGIGEDDGGGDNDNTFPLSETNDLGAV